MIYFTNHALLKLKQREISQSVVKETINSPNYELSSHSGRIIAYKKFDKRHLKVIYKIENSNVVVITQHWERKLKLTK